MKNLAYVISECVGSLKRCDQTSDWVSRYEARLAEIERNYLPSGSGIDSGTKINREKSTEHKIVLEFDYHHMNDTGYYTGWSPYTVTIIPTFNGIEIARITGRDEYLKDMLADQFHYALSEPLQEKALSEIYSK